VDTTIASAVVLRRESQLIGRKPTSAFAVPRPCCMCGLQLEHGERKVHRGLCRRARESALQRRRRQRGRLARPELAARLV